MIIFKITTKPVNILFCTKIIRVKTKMDSYKQLLTIAVWTVSITHLPAHIFNKLFFQFIRYFFCYFLQFWQLHLSKTRYMKLAESCSSDDRNPAVNIVRMSSFEHASLFFGTLLGWRTAVGSGWQWEADSSASRAVDSRQDPSGPACSSERRPDPAQLCEIKLTSCFSWLAQLKLLDWLPHYFTGLALCTGAAFFQWRMKESLDCLVEVGETELIQTIRGIFQLVPTLTDSWIQQ